MGLDMHACSVDRTVLGDKLVDFSLTELLGGEEGVKDAEYDGRLVREFAYWRKFNHLHGWMHRMYQMAGGEDEDFNCSNLRLGAVLIAKLRQDAKSLMPTSGFFFGRQEPMTEEDVQTVINFCDRCEEAFRKGHDIVYFAWY